MTDPIVYVRPFSARDLTHHHPQYVYEGQCPVNSDPDDPDSPFVVICQLTSNTNEAGLWCTDECTQLDPEHVPLLRKSYQSQGTRFAAVWQDCDRLNLTTGRVETDPRKFARHLADKSKEMEDRLGMPVDFQPCDPSDTYVSDEGLDATHDRAVQEGRKDSRGRFVWTVR